jgi:hypothetical protein
MPNPTEPSKNFGNLAFSNYTMETTAERCILAIQAALRVKGYAESHDTMKKVLRLKRSMGRNKTRRYTFNLIQSKPTGQVQGPQPVEGDDYSSLLIPLLEETTGLQLHSKEAKKASSGHFMVKFVMVGLSDARVASNQNQVRQDIARTVVEKLGDSLSSFSVQPFRLRMDKGRVALSVQCIYRGSDV